MMRGVMKAGFRSFARLARIGALVIPGSLLMPGGAPCKPAYSAPPTWRITPQPPRVPVKARTPKTKRPQAEPSATAQSGWAASSEPVSTGSVGEEVPPLPGRKPAEIAAPPAAAMHPEKKAAAGPEGEKPAPIGAGDVVTTEVLGEEERPHAESPADDASAGKQYCSNIANAAADARAAWQKKELLQTEQDVAKRIEELDAKIGEYRKWMARRDEFSRKAQAAVVDIYAKMKPDAAAQQLAILDEEMAAAVLIKLNPRIASAVMNEMESKRAARLTAIISNATKGPGNKPPAPPEKAP